MKDLHLGGGGGGGGNVVVVVVLQCTPHRLEIKQMHKAVSAI